jgi:hypothetical protein
MSEMKTTRRNVMGMLAATAASGFVKPAMAQEKRPKIPGGPGRVSTGRPQTDFIYAQIGPGHILTPENSRPGVFGSTLSYDMGLAAVSVVMRYPKGWVLDRPHFNDSDEEFYVLEGSLTIDGVEYTTGSYAYLPAGMQRLNMHSIGGGTVLTCYGGQHLNFYEEAPAGMYDPNRLIRHIETDKLKWKKPENPELENFTGGALRKTLRVDPVTGDTTWLLKVRADDPRKVTERRVAIHSAVDEILVLEGQISSPHGIMGTGAYAWRLPGAVVGPLGTKTGFTAICRSKGGPLGTTWSENEQPIAWNAPYNPDIPDMLREAAFKPFPATQRY